MVVGVVGDRAAMGKNKEYTFRDNILSYNLTQPT